MSTLYLDNAATTFPKPPGVYDAMLHYGTTLGASPGRGQYASSREGARLIALCRQRLATLLNAESPSSIVFTLNTSDALNMAIKGVLRRRRLDRAARGAPLRVVTTVMDHNSVLRPLHALGDEDVETVCVRADPSTGLVDPVDVARAIDRWTALVAVNMASNVGGTIQPVADIARVCQAAGVPCLVDAAQALGHLPVDVQALGVDFLAFPGHKGLLGPQGTGGLYVRPGALRYLATTREGGTGSWSESEGQPSTMPEHLEAGSHNTLGIVGLSEAVAWILDRGVATLREHERTLCTLMLEGLQSGGCLHPAWDDQSSPRGPLAAFRLLGPADADLRVGVFALVHQTLAPSEVATLLETRYGILARAGLTCAPEAHRTFGSLAAGGAFRLSFGPFVQPADVRRTLQALHEIAQEWPSALVGDCNEAGFGESVAG